MKYLKKFENHSAYEAAQSGLILPNVSLCVQENEVHYNPSTPPTPVETRLVCKYITEYEDEEIRLLNYEGVLGSFSAMEIDGVAQPSVVTAYTFDTVGEHTVKYTLTDPTSIGNDAFIYCTGLTSIDIPNSVTSIPNEAFQECIGLTSCTIGSGVTSIGDAAFWECNGLTSITVEATTPPTLGSQSFDYSNSCPIYVPSASVETYKSASGWSNYASRIQAIP